MPTSSTVPSSRTVGNIPTIATLPNATSSDYDAMAQYWEMVESLIGGTLIMRKSREKYLPRFPLEEKDDYDYRLNNSVFTNVYGDIVNNLAAKPFAEELQLIAPVDPQFEELAKDIDGRGNSLHVFSQETFYWGLNLAVDWILVDYPKVQPQQQGPRPLTIADEKAQGLRPYWIHVTAPRMLAVYSDSVGGEEIFTHARISEVTKERWGFSELMIERVRVFDREPIVDKFNRTVDYAPATFQLWEKRTMSGTTANDVKWILVDEGEITIGVIPIVPFVTGKRIESSWQFIPPMRDCAFAQIEHYQAETALKSIKELTAYPMLAGQGVTAPSGDKDKKIRVGARAIVYAPMYGDTGRHGEWKFIEPAGTSLKFLADEIDRLEKQMRELGRQPLTAQSGNLTVVTTAFAAQKGNSAVQTWALNLKDALEQAWYLTSLWVKKPANETEVRVYTDFALEAGEDLSPPWLLTMRSSGDLSQPTLWEEMRRRNVLSPQFDPDEEAKRLAKEVPPPPSPEDLKAALTLGAHRPTDVPVEGIAKPANAFIKGPKLPPPASTKGK